MSKAAFVLRHNPGSVGLTLDPNGWVSVDEFADAMGMSASGVVEMAEKDRKGRYEVCEGRIRARYGHSVNVTLGLEPETPPVHLFHGTTASALIHIAHKGIRPMSRNYVHLSERPDVAIEVAYRHSRRATPVLLRVRAAALAENQDFYRTAAGVWLTRHVPWEMTEIID